MTDVTRRTLFGTTVGLAGAALIPSAQAASDPQEPQALRGSVTDGKVALPPLHNPSEMNGEVANPLPPGKRLGVAVVGLGTLALENIIPGFGEAKSVRLAALVSGEPDKMHAVAAEHGVPERSLYTYDTFDRIRDDPGIDIVYIVLPNALHAEFTIRAAKAGKHVLCEKPMATTIGDAQHMVEACRAAGRKLMIAYRLQYEATHRALIGLARGGALGPTRLITAVNVQNDADNGQWRQIRAMAGGGSLPDVGLYCLNAARYVTGEEPVEVAASVFSPAGDARFREIEDVCRFSLRFPSGLFFYFGSSY